MAPQLRSLEEEVGHDAEVAEVMNSERKGSDATTAKVNTATVRSTAEGEAVYGYRTPTGSGRSPQL